MNIVSLLHAIALGIIDLEARESESFIHVTC
jgi:hypothetical protein